MVKIESNSSDVVVMAFEPRQQNHRRLLQQVESGKFGNFKESINGTKKRREPKFLRLFAGGASAFVATAITCPLDVVKTRQQSSLRFAATAAAPSSSPMVTSSSSLGRHVRSMTTSPYQQSTFMQQLIHMWRNEGLRSLFKGLAPSLIGAVSSRALFFFTYEHAKADLKEIGFSANHNAFLNHMVAATAGGLVCTTATCPLWVIKLRQQLHKKYNNNSLTMAECCKRTWQKEGFRGFFRGLFVSYAGIAELIIYFGIYEQLRDLYMRSRYDMTANNKDIRDMWDLPGLMVISGFARCVSCTFCYPSEVIRVRVREEMIQKKYCRVIKTLFMVGKNEGFAGLYGGLPAQLTRQAFNMAILMGVYETIMYQYQKYENE